MRKLTDDQAKALLLAQELLALDALPHETEDALKAWILETLDIAVVPAWIINGRELPSAGLFPVVM